MNYNTVDFLVELCPLLACISAIVFIVCFARIIIDLQYPPENPNPAPRIVGALCLILFIVSLLGNASFTTRKNNMLETYVSSGYSVYYNGEKTEGSKLDISKYSVTVNEEKEEIYLSDKPASSRSYVPVVIPR